ncbi:MAG: MarR family transcriptional regulator [Tenuifilaceae bacterium]|jgi:DNA-binding MarR family transcriptional regulator|nr:MarR family transcriptional regulator [Tenuifilaceae bacterium]
MDEQLQQLIATFLAHSEQQEEEVWSKSEFTDLTFKQLAYIQVVGLLHNPTLSEIAEANRVSRPTATVSIDRLQQKGYVVRVQSDTDKRSAHVHLTSKGEKAFMLHQEVHNGIAKRLIKALLPSERQCMANALQRFLSDL